MRALLKKVSLFAVVVAAVGLLLGTVHAEAAVKWAFSTSNGQKKANVNKTITMEKGEYQDMNLYRNGKQIKEKDATYSVKWYSSDKNVVYIDKASGKMKADKYGKMKKDTGSAKITAVITNKKTGTTAKKSFTVKVKAVPVPEIKETPASAFEYEIINGKEVNIVKLADRTLQEVLIPEKIDGYPVTGIGKEAFYYCSNLVSIEIPVSVKRIGENAFIGTPWLEQLKLDNQYLILGDGVLYWVSPEAEGVFAIPKNVKRIGAGAFQDSNITGVKIPSSVTEIGARAFQWCINLADIEIPSSVTSIGEDAFLGTAWLKQQEETKTFLVLGDGVLAWVSRKAEGAFVVPSNVKRIGGGAFKWCDKITSIEIPSGVASIGESAFYDCKKLTSVNIPSGVTEIANYAFYGCTSLTEVKIPNTVTKIGDSAFEQCSKLESVKIPSGVTSIGANAFNWCSSLSSIEIPSGVKSISNSAFNWTPWLTQQKKDNTLLILGDGILYWASDEISGELVIPSNVKKIAWSFSYTGLTKVVIPEGVTSIEGGTFEYCSSLVSVKLPSSIVDIGQRAFAGCSKLTDIVIPESVKSIGEEAFASCSGLTGIKLPAGLSSIKRGTFQYCKSLTKVEIPSSVSSIEADAFRSCSALAKVTIRNGVKSIGSEAFAYCTGLKTMTIPSSVESIGDNAFYNTAWLENQKKSQNYLVLGDGILYWVSTDTKGTFVVPDGVKLIAGNAFADCNKITEVKLPNSVKMIGDKAFFNCTALKKLVLPSSVKEIGAMAFYNCEKLATINVDKVSSIGYGAFVNCKSLSKIELPTGITQIHGSVWSMTGEDDCSGMFAGCSKLESIVIPEGVMEIGEGAFENCKNLKSISLPESLLRIKRNAFIGCSSLESIYIPKNVEFFERDLPSIERSGGDGASMDSNTKRMRECDSLKEIVVDAGNKYYTSVDGVLFNKEKTILLGVPDGYVATSYQVPSGTLMIADAAFLNCKNIKTIMVPESVQRIEEDAFDQCDKLTKITFLGNNEIYYFDSNALYERWFSSWGDLVAVELVRVFGANVTEMYISEDVTEVSSDTFINCKNLKSIRVSESNEKYTSVDGVLYSKDKSYIVAIPAKYESLVIAPGVDAMGVLWNAIGLKEIILEDGITSLPYEVTAAPNLEILHIPATVDWLDDYDSVYLTDVTIYAPSGSEAEAWAKRNGLTFVEE